MHEDIRVFELALLPNAPLSQPDMRARYGLKTRFKPIRLTEPGFEREMVELVFGTGSMPYADWADCLLFAETIQALHNGAFTRFIAIYLHREGLLTYRRFYESLLDHLIADTRGIGRVFGRLKKLIDDYHADPDMPQVNRILTQPDMLTFLRRYHPTRKGWPLWTWLWLNLSEDQNGFYHMVTDALASKGVDMDAPLLDLLHYQQEIMLTPQYDPGQGKVVACHYNWHDYFFAAADLMPVKTTLRYVDTHMGPSRQYPLIAHDSAGLCGRGHRALLSVLQVQAFFPSAGPAAGGCGISACQGLPCTILPPHPGPLPRRGDSVPRILKRCRGPMVSVP